ncbi:MAG: sigma-54-dependent Fis family transcriptional regulator [Myxococcales bacterium]|nr:sigma-54-dependent Fis family transcriptional regulator [Myxococcales bacterium]
MAQSRILVVDDEALIRWSLSERLSEEGHLVAAAEDGAAAVKSVELEPPDLILLDYRLPDTTGIELLRQFRQSIPDVPVILMTGHSSVEHAVSAMREGAFHYAVKPLNLEEIAVLAEKALESRRLRTEIKALRQSSSAPYAFEQIVGESTPMQRVKRLMRKIAMTQASTILLTGESGTGKDLAAKAIHYNSDRKDRPFMNITCSALQETLLESELFGHERGAFTDAKRQKKGLLEQAQGGTVFLDEIGETTPGMQSKLLRFLEDKTFKRVGGATDVKVDVRVIAATNRDLPADVRAGQFRQDLYYRLTVLPIELPPLRDRVGDVPRLLQFFIARFNEEFRKRIVGVTADAMAALGEYGWPGNVRELRNAVERAMLLADGDELGVDDFMMLLGAPVLEAGRFELPAAGIDLEQVEQDFVRQALERTGGNRTKAAKLLAISRDQMRYRVEKFGL